MMSPNQLAAYGLSEDFAHHNLVVRSGNRRTASPATDRNDVIDSRIPLMSSQGEKGRMFLSTVLSRLMRPSLSTLIPKKAIKSISRVWMPILTNLGTRVLPFQGKHPPQIPYGTTTSITQVVVAFASWRIVTAWETVWSLWSPFRMSHLCRAQISFCNTMSTERVRDAWRPIGDRPNDGRSNAADEGAAKLDRDR